MFVFEYLTGGGTELPGEGDPALLAMGRAMRDALVADLGACTGWPLSVAGCSAAPAPAGVAAVAARPGEGLADFVARQACLHDACWLVAPETGGLLGSLMARLPPGRAVGAQASAVALASRKSALLAWLQARGVRTPLALADAATRWVLKPDDGAGGLGIRVFTNRPQAQAQRQARQGADTPLTLEPWVEGEPGSLSVLVGPGGSAELLSVNRQHITVAADGALRYGGVCTGTEAPGSLRWQQAQALVRQVHAAVPGLAGFYGLDIVWSDRCGPVLIELNPRLTCAYVGLSAALGRNLAAEALSAWAAHG